MAYAAVCFDLFDTLVRFSRDRFPTIQIDGRTVRSTAGRLHAVLAAHVPGVTLEACYAAMVGSWEEAERLRAIDHREVPAPARFADLFQRLALDPAAFPPGLVDALLDAHRQEIARAALFPSPHRDLLARVAGRYRVALVSNFDYTPTALGILESAGVRALFDVVVISDAIGWRKPRPDIFHAALSGLGVAPEAALFVGDRADIDVAGAHGVGMDAAWINPAADPLPAGIEPPRFEIRDLAELGPILGV
jgi:FMN phosphatase YigB (HAD superfamily)